MVPLLGLSTGSGDGGVFWSRVLGSGPGVDCASAGGGLLLVVGTG